MTNAVIVGNGAREHAIAKALIESGTTLRAFMSARNPAIASLCNEFIKISSLTNFTELEKFAQGADFVVVGPESPLVVGIANALKSAGIPCIGPVIDVAQLEGSKMFTRNLLEKHGFKSNILFKEFKEVVGVEEWIDELGVENVVVKPDGLTGGKGVKVFGEHMNSKEEIILYCKEIVNTGDYFIIEEKLDGEEFTLQAFVDGTHVISTPIVQDHKRAYEGDTGPNTGGMGSYSMEDHLMPFVTQDDVNFAQSEMEKTIRILKQEYSEYKGFLYGQFMKTKKGIKLVEYNVRLGDPEAMNVLGLLESDFTEICYDIIDGRLKNNIKFKKMATVCKYLVPEGYPVDPQKNQSIEVDEQGIKKAGADFYYASVNEKNKVIYTSGSRTLALLGIGPTLEEAEKIAENSTQYVHGKLFHRTDVGTRNLLNKRINHMDQILKE